MTQQPTLDTSEHGTIYIWECTNGVQLKLSGSAYHLLKSIEDGASFDDIAASLNQRGNTTATGETVEDAYRRLKARIDDLENGEPPLPTGFWLRLPLLSSGLTGLLTRPLAPLFHRPVAVLLCFGIIAVTVAALSRSLAINVESGAYWAGYGLFTLTLFAHELGHAAAVRRHGLAPGAIGTGIYWLFPVFYADVSIAWKLKRQQRVVVDLAGVYLQLLLAAGYGVAYLVTGWDALRIALLLVLITNLFLFNPFLKYDGYWLVSDALGVTNLSRQPGRILGWVRDKLRGRQPVPLPWPRYVVIALSVYSVATVLFWLVLAWFLLPAFWSLMGAYPALLNEFISSVLAAPLSLDAGLVARFAISTYFLCIAGLIVRQLGIPLLLSLWRRFFTRRMQVAS